MTFETTSVFISAHLLFVCHLEQPGKNTRHSGIELGCRFLIFQVDVVGRAHHACAVTLFVCDFGKCRLFGAANALAGVDVQIPLAGGTGASLLGDLDICDGHEEYILDGRIDDGFNKAGDGHVLVTAAGRDTDGSPGHDTCERRAVAAIQGCLGCRHTGSGYTQDLCLQLELRRFWVINDMVTLRADGIPDRTFKVEVGYIGGIADLDEDSSLVRTYGIKKYRVGHSCLDVQVALGNTGVHGGTAVQDGQQNCEDQGYSEVSHSVAVHLSYPFHGS